MRLAYGYVLEENDPFIEVSREAMRYFAICTMSHFWVNWFPICKSIYSSIGENLKLHLELVRYVPSWFPGAQFQRLGREGREIREQYSNDPFQPVFEAVVSTIRRAHNLWLLLTFQHIVSW